MRLRRVVLILTSSALAFIPSPARASSPGGAFCFPGAFQACASVTIQSIQFDGSGGGDGVTDFVIRVINYGGRTGVPDSGPFAIVSLTLSNLTASCPSEGFAPGTCALNNPTL